MANLITTLTESVTLNGSVRGSTNTVTTTGIGDVLERIVTCTHSQTTTIATFAAAPYTSAGAIDVENVRYIRVTNLGEDSAVILAVVMTDTNYQVRLPAGTSHILPRAEAEAIGEEDNTPDFTSQEDLISLQVKPEGTTYSPRVELFVGVAE
jgi:hypothetical protein